MSERSGATGFFQVAGMREILEAFSWVAPREPERVPLLAALGRALARDAVAAIDAPHFTRAAMDGYAVAAADTFKRKCIHPKLGPQGFGSIRRWKKRDLRNQGRVKRKVCLD